MSSLPSWLLHRPLIHTLRLELPHPSLNDNLGDLDRLTRALKQDGFSPLHLEAVRFGYMSEQIRLGDFKVTVTLGYTPLHWEILDLKAGSSHPPSLGFAVDLGSTRLAFYLVDLESGKILDEESAANPQIPYGEDILTRILFARQEENRKLMQQILIEAFNRSIHELLERNGFHQSSVYALAVAGNPTMSHFFLGLNASNICKEPYIPVANTFPFLHAEDLGLALHTRALVYVFPNVGSYFGGDLIAGILAAGMHRSEEVNLLVDVGTNAEVVLGNRDWLIACAGAAGPALEGGVVERGMMAAPGAIDHVRIDRQTYDTSYHVLGGGKPRGICGSGLIDLIAEMFMSGILTIQGKLNGKLHSRRIVETGEGLSYVVAFGEETEDGEDLTVSDIDIGIFLKSKAAMYTILTVITNKVGVTFRDIGRFFVAGTFGNYIDPAMAIRIGMVPDLPVEKYEGLENTAGFGAAMALLDRGLFDEIEKICSRITYVELNVNMELMNEFRGALFLPHTNPKLFPSVEIPEKAFG